MGQYAWTIIQDYRASETAPKGTPLNAVGMVFPGNARRSHEDIVGDAHGRQFRLRGPQGLCYEGIIIGEFQGREPLEDFGRTHGATEIEFLEREPLWRTIDHHSRH